MSHPLIPIRTYLVCLTEFAGPINRASFQTFYAQAGLGHPILPKMYFVQVIRKIVQVVINPCPAEPGYILPLQTV